MKRALFQLIIATFLPLAAHALPPAGPREAPAPPLDLRALDSFDLKQALNFPQTKSVTDVPANSDELAQRIRDILARTRTPGGAVAIIEDGQTTWTGAFGFADLAQRRPVTMDTMFRCGSISKSILSLAVLRLVEKGKISLDMKMQDVLPEVSIENPWEQTDPVRLVHLLEHTAGFDDWHFNEIAHDDPTPVSLEQALKVNSNPRRVRWRPGTCFSYSNVGPAVAARLLEKVTGRKYEDLVRDEVLIPLGIPSASYYLTPDVEGRLVRGYQGDGVTEVPYWHILYRPVGALNVSVNELTHMVRALIGRGTIDGRRLLTASTVHRMETPTTTLAARAGMAFGHGLGNLASFANGFVFHGHDGGMPGHLAVYAYHPGKGCGYVIMINATTPALGEIQQLLGAYLTKGWKRKEPQRVELPPETMREMAGTYRFATPRHEITRFLMRWFSVGVIHSDGALFLEFPGLNQDIELIPVGNNLFAVQRLETPLFAISKDPDGRYAFQMAYMSFDRVPEFILKTERQIFSWISYAILSGLAAMLFWLPRMRIPFLSSGTGPIIPWPPMVPLCFFLAWMISLFTLGDDTVQKVGHLTLRSATIWFLSWGFGLSSFWAIPATLRWTPSTGSPLSILYALAISLACVVLTLYLGYFGLIGIRTWAY